MLYKLYYIVLNRPYFEKCIVTKDSHCTFSCIKIVFKKKFFFKYSDNKWEDKCFIYELTIIAFMPINLFENYIESKI